MPKTNSRPFVPGGSFTTEADAKHEARRLTKERSPEIWTSMKVPNSNRFAIIRKS